MRRKHLALVGPLALLLLSGFPTDARAQLDDQVSLHGFGGWAAGWTNNANSFAHIASEDGELANYNFALNIAARPAEKLAIHAQAFWGENLSGQTVDLDFAFAQWEVSPALKFRVGKVLSPFGLYTEIYEVGTLRPFYLLPQGMYAGPGLVTKAYLGAGLTGTYAFENDWEISYDLYGGETRMQDFDVEIPVGFDPQTGRPILGHVNMTPIGRDVIGTQVSLSPGVEGLRFGASYMGMEVYSSRDGGHRQQGTDREGERSHIVAGHLEYLTDALSIRAELFDMSGGDKVKGGYVEAAYKFPVGVQLAAQYDWHENATPSTVDRTPAESLLTHDGFALGLNYWFSPDLVVKLNYHRIDGNVFAKPASPITAIITGTLEEKTNVFILGTQFSF